MLILLRSGRSRLVRLSIRLVLISKKEKRRHRPAVPPSCAAAHLRQPKDNPPQPVTARARRFCDGTALQLFCPTRRTRGGASVRGRYDVRRRRNFLAMIKLKP